MSVATTLRGLRRDVRRPDRSATPGPAIRARGIGVVLDGASVLDDVDVDVDTGHLLALVGPNGAGKSTLLSVLAGDRQPERGDVEIDGLPVGSWSAVEMAMRRAVLLQQVTLSFPFTVRQMVEMGRAPWAGQPEEADDERRVVESMAATDVSHLAERTVPSLSGGERARAALARVLAQDTGILLLDEPTAALDVRHQEQVLALAADAAAAGRAVVVVMHDLGLAAAHADRVVVLAGGSVAADGAPADVLTAPLLSEVYEHPIDVLRHPQDGRLLIVPGHDRPSATIRHT